MKRKDSKAWMGLRLYKMLEAFISEREGEIPVELLGVKARREYQNFYWFLKEDVRYNRLGYYLEVSKIYRYNIAKGHFDKSLFKPNEQKLYFRIAYHPVKCFIKELFYKRKLTSTHDKRYFLGVQYYSKRRKSQSSPVPAGGGNDFRQATFSLIQSVWQVSGCTDELLNQLKLFSQSRYAIKNLREEIIYVYIACLIERGEYKQAQNVLRLCQFDFKFASLYRYPYVSDFCLQNGVSDTASEKSAYVARCLEENMNSGEFEKYLQGKSIAVVGNSGCDLGKGKGAEIDSHDIVIRFNSYPSGYVQDYGKKTNVWVRASGAFPNDVLNRDVGNFDYVIWNQDFKHSVIMFDLLPYMYNDCKRCPKKYLYLNQECRHSFAEASLINFPSSGAIFLWYLYKCLGSFDNVDVYGFAFLNNKMDTIHHYFDNRKMLPKEHNFDGEIGFLNALYFGNKNVSLITK